MGQHRQVSSRNQNEESRGHDCKNTAAIHETNWYDEDIYGPRPDGWIHGATLVSTMFGRPSPSEDVDLELTDSCGPSNRKRKAPTSKAAGKNADSPVYAT